MLKVLRDGKSTEEDVGCLCPAEYEAHLIHMRHEERSARWMLQAGILARQTSEVLGEYLAIDPATVEAYERLFFDIRDKLDHSGYVVTHVFEAGASYACNHVDRAIERWLGRVAYHSGWDIVRRIWEENKPTLEASTFLRETLVDSIFTDAINSLSRSHEKKREHAVTVEAAIEVLRGEIELGGPAQDTEIQHSLRGLLNSISLKVVPSRGKLPAEEPRQQAANPFHIQAEGHFADPSEPNEPTAQKEEKNSGP